MAPWRDGSRDPVAPRPGVMAGILRVLLLACLLHHALSESASLPNDSQSTSSRSLSRRDHWLLQELIRVAQRPPPQQSSSPSSSLGSIPDLGLNAPPASEDDFMLGEEKRRHKGKNNLNIDDYLPFFPEEVLESNAHFRPVQVRVVEHEDFIDYELDFVEEDETPQARKPQPQPQPRRVGSSSSAYNAYDGGASHTRWPPSKRPSHRYASTEKSVASTLHFPGTQGVTFANLLERARKRHRELRRSTTPVSLPRPTTSPATPATPHWTSSTTPYPAHKAFHNRFRVRNRSFHQRNRMRKKLFHHYQPRLKKPAHPPEPVRRTYLVASTNTPTRPTTIRTTTAAPLITSPTTTMPDPRPPSTHVFTHLRTASAMLVTRNVTSKRVVTAPPQANYFTFSTVVPLVSTTTRSTTSTTESYFFPTTFMELFKDPPFPTTTSTTTTTTTPTTTTPLTTPSPPRVLTDYEEYPYVPTTRVSEALAYTRPPPPHPYPPPLPLSSSSPLPPAPPATTPPPSTWNEAHEEDAHEAHRIPRIIDTDWEDRIPNIYSGQYHEVNPGQYDPEKYNTGNYKPQLWEKHPTGEYKPQHWEQYPNGPYDPQPPPQPQRQQHQQSHPQTSSHPSDVKVEIENTGEDKKVYNVQSKVDDFIIGEYGTISESSGQTLRGVRYTAVDSSVDQKLIYDTLTKFFNFS